MTEQQEQPQDASGVQDQVVVNQPNPNLSRDAEGNRVYDEGVSGPDPRVWGTDDERPDPFLFEDQAKEGAGGVAPDTISAEGVSGPDSRFWTKEVDANGIEQYVGRDYMLMQQEGPPVTDLRTPEVVQEQQGWMAEVDQQAAANTISPSEPESTGNDEGGTDSA